METQAFPFMKTKKKGDTDMNELLLFCKKNNIGFEIVYYAPCDSIDLRAGTLQEHQYELVVFVKGYHVDYNHILDYLKKKLQGAYIP